MSPRRREHLRQRAARATGSAVVWSPEPFQADDGSVPYERFVNGLSDVKFLALDAAVEFVLCVRGIDLVRTEWLKALGEGLHEFRVRHDEGEIVRMFGQGSSRVGGSGEIVMLRVFVHFYGSKVVLLLGGYDKGVDSKERRQQREIAEAWRLLTEFKERQRRDRKGRR